MDTTEDDYFNGESDEEEIGPTPPMPVLSTSPSGGQKRKRPGDLDQVNTTPPTKSTKLTAGGRSLSGGVLGLDYDDGSDSDSSEASPQTPSRDRALRPSAPIQNESTNSLSASPMGDKDASLSNPQFSPGTRLKLKVGTPLPPAGEDLDEIASRMAKKRKQETEQDDDSFGSLLTGSKAAASKSVKTEQIPNIREKPPSGVVGLGLAMKDAGKKLKINLFGSKKTTQETDKKKSGSPNPTS